MEEQLAHTDDSSHYEISLTAGQAFMAFVLLLLSLAASFAFGLMIGKGQADERLVVRKETPVVSEGSVLPPKSKGERGEIVELGVADDDFRESEPSADTTTTATDSAATDTAAATITDTAAPAVTASVAEPVVVHEAAVVPAATPAATPAPAAAVKPAATPAATAAVKPAAQRQQTTTYAQLLSTGDQKTAEALAAKLIDRGFTSAYVERGATEKGPVYRVRVKFGSEAEARAAESKLKEFSNDVWITSR